MNESLHFAQADPWTQDHLSLIFDKRVPRFDSAGPLGLERQKDHFRGEGVSLANALLSHLPGRLVDALLVALLDHKRSCFCVPYRRGPEAIGD